MFGSDFTAVRKGSARWLGTADVSFARYSYGDQAKIMRRTECETGKKKFGN
jgi:hypothetical protein